MISVIIWIFNVPQSHLLKAWSLDRATTVKGWDFYGLKKNEEKEKANKNQRENG